MTAERIDPRVARTKTELKAALMDLMEKRRWEKIRVQDILDQTGISRSAFYAHYGNKYDLLMEGTPTLAIPYDAGEPNFLPLIEHVDEAADFMRPLLSQPVLGEVMADSHRSLVAMWTTHFADTEFADDWILPELLAGGLIAMIRAYVNQRTRERPEVVCARFDEYVAQVLATR